MGAMVSAPFSHHAWIGYWERVPACAPRVVIQRRQVTDGLLYLPAGQVDVRWLNRGVERRYHAAAGTVRFDPADQELNTFIGERNPAHDFYTLLIPAQHLREIIGSEGIEAPTLRHLLVPDDAELQWCLARLGSRPAGGANDALGLEEAARRLTLRLHQLCDGPRPDWSADTSVFDPVTLANLVHYVDAHLRLAPTLSEMAMLVGLSPSHFAKKFRLSTGFSLQRLVNRRRVLASMPLLQANTLPLVQVALDLGFSSQSHFTRLFSGLTGMTPAKYRKQFRRTVGWRQTAPERPQP
jgi:AraC-like DNA-binding protein